MTIAALGLAVFSGLFDGQRESAGHYLLILLITATYPLLLHVPILVVGPFV